MTLDIVSADGANPSDRLFAQLALIASSRKRTLPGSRSLGLTGTAQDLPTAESVNAFGVELQTACDEWIPGIGIVGVTRTEDFDGGMTLMIEVDSD